MADVLCILQRYLVVNSNVNILLTRRNDLFFLLALEFRELFHSLANNLQSRLDLVFGDNKWRG